ncbi:MAG: hypothetical protein ABW048_11835 [Sphingobium sp.]
MRISVMIAAGAALLAACGAQAAMKTPQERLAKALEGRVAGKPVDCINLRDIRSSEIIDRTAIIYTVGRTLYLNTPESGAAFLNRGDILVTDTRSPQLCSIDVVRLVNSPSNMNSGSVGLGKFVPYTKPAG